jgi:hypothetical protein
MKSEDDKDEAKILNAYELMIEYDCYISESLMIPFGGITKETLSKLQEYPFGLIRESTGSRVVVTILAESSNHVLQIINDDFPGWEIES